MPRPTPRGTSTRASTATSSRVVYRLASDRVDELWAWLRDTAAELVAEVEVLASAYLGDRGEVARVTMRELAERLETGDVVVLDVRPAAEYRAGHIARARNVPPDALGDELSLDGAEVVACCRGPYCVYSDDAVRLRRARGVDARRLDVGFPEWRRARLPVATVA